MLEQKDFEAIRLIMREEVQDELQKQTIELREELGTELSEKLRVELGAELSEKLRVELGAELSEKLRTELGAELSEKLVKLGAELSEKLRSELSAELSEKLRVELGTELSEKLRVELGTELSEKLRTELGAELRSDFEETLKAEIGHSENRILSELDRVQISLEKKIKNVEDTTAELVQYYKITKLENDNGALLLHMIDNLDRRVRGLEHQMA